MLRRAAHVSRRDLFQLSSIGSNGVRSSGNGSRPRRDLVLEQHSRSYHKPVFVLVPQSPTLLSRRPALCQTSFIKSSIRLSSSGRGDKKLPESKDLPKATSSTSARIASGAAAATQQLEQRIKRVVEDLNIGDQLSVIVIALFTALLLLAPSAARYMQASDQASFFEIDATDDPVDALAKLAREGWSIPEGGTESNVLETVLKDVFKSKALQAAAQEFVVEIIQSEPFKQAVARLVKELWTDLVTDAETLAQVIELLRRAIEDPTIRKAAQDLVLHVFVQEPEVRDALIRTIQNLGNEDVIQTAVVKLLTESTHTTLNDPEILEHSMEFATDVVGDDIVQRTAGEALRKSVGHAVRPATTVVLTSLGVGLIVFGIVAVGYSRSTEREIRLFESAVKSLQSNTMYGIGRMITWPARQVGSLSEASIIGAAPWRLLQGATNFLIAGVSASTGWMGVLSSWTTLVTTGSKRAWSSLSCTVQSLYRDIFGKSDDYTMG